jgi:23S rRNA (cytosine1962-C5)-methyltransferase
MSDQFPILRLKPDREVHLHNRHHAIFQAVVAEYPKVEDGAIVEVRSAKGAFLCYAHLNRKAYICGRAIAWRQGDPLAQVEQAIRKSIALREIFFRGPETTAFRLVNAEGDGIPGLIVDRYDDVLCVQMTTLGMDRMRDWIVGILVDACKPRGIYEKSTSPARKKEGIDAKEGWIHGGGSTQVVVTERGMQIRIELAGGQKTGLFLDQREMRALVRELAPGRTVLDICSYVGGFSLAALLGGALAADAVDYDADALREAQENIRRNGIEADRLGTYAEDAFVFLRRAHPPRAYDFVILDPPAFAKRSQDVEPAKKAYTDLNRLGMQALRRGGLLLTCSCSYQIDEPLFRTIVFHAARQAGKSVRILQHHRHAVDHPVNLFHPETDYLKSLLLWVE